MKSTFAMHTRTEKRIHESNLGVSGIKEYHENALFKSFEPTWCELASILWPASGSGLDAGWPSDIDAGLQIYQVRAHFEALEEGVHGKPGTIKLDSNLTPGSVQVWIPMVIPPIFSLIFQLFTLLPQATLTFPLLFLSPFNSWFLMH